MVFACQGTTMSPIAMMSVTKNSKRTIPLGVLLITVCLALIYGLMAVVAAGVLPIEQVANKNLALVAQAIFPNWLYVIFIIGGVVFAIATSLISGIAMMRYPAMRVAQDGWLPDFFKKTTKSGYPWVIQLTFYLFSILPIIFGFSLDSIVSLTMIPSMLMCFAQNISLIKIVKKFPKQWNESVIHMPTPIFNVLCVIAGICDLIVAYNLFVTMASDRYAAGCCHVRCLRCNRSDPSEVRCHRPAGSGKQKAGCYGRGCQLLILLYSKKASVSAPALLYFG